MRNFNSGVFLGCVMLSMAMDAAQFLSPELVAFSFLVKGGIMVILLRFPIMMYLRKSTYRSLDILLLTILSIVFFIYSLSSDFPSDSIDRATKQIFLIIIYLSFIYLLRSNFFRRDDLVLLATVCLLIIVPTSFSVTFNPSNEHLVQAAGPYTIMWLLMFSFLVAKPSDRLLRILMLLAVLVLLLIMKRGAIICFGVAFVTWLILKNRYYPRVNTVAITAVTMLVFTGIFAVFWSIRGEQFAERLQDTSGSGRDILYGFIIQGLIEADEVQLFFGHGSMAVQVLTGNTLGIREGAKFGLQSHSDWLTLAYDFGILGLMLFLLFHLALLRKIREIRRRLPDLYIRLFPLHSAFILSSIFSETLFNTSLIFLYLFIAIASSPLKFRTILHDT